MKDLFSLQKAGLIVSAVILLPCVSMVNVEMDHFSKHLKVTVHHIVLSY